MKRNEYSIYGTKKKEYIKNWGRKKSKEKEQMAKIYYIYYYCYMIYILYTLYVIYIDRLIEIEKNGMKFYFDSNTILNLETKSSKYISPKICNMVIIDLSILILYRLN